MSTSIHPTAIVDSKAELGSAVSIGPYCLIGPDVVMGENTELLSHAVVTGRTTMGSGNRVFPFSSIGQDPQDLKYHGEDSEVIIGDNNTFRENVTVNSGTEGGGMVTRIGNNNMLMAYTHVAHDCILGNSIVLANCSTLAGHVEVADSAIIGGLSAVQQFVRIGQLAMIGGMSGVTKDVPPFCLVAGGYRVGLSGLNVIGLKRQGYKLEQINHLKEVYRALLQESGKRDERLAAARVLAGEDKNALSLIEFISSAKRGLTMHGRDSE
jgi:UDP-N-acetylglucosamine acyltransferase